MAKDKDRALSAAMILTIDSVVPQLQGVVGMSAG